MVRPAGLLGAARLAPPGSPWRAINVAARRCRTPFLSVVGSKLSPVYDSNRLARFGIFLRNGAPGGIRPHDPRLRRPILYPAELQARRRGGDTTRGRQGASSGAAVAIEIG